MPLVQKELPQVNTPSVNFHPIKVERYQHKKAYPEDTCLLDVV